MSGNYRIYLSSTYSDLQELRSKAKETILDLGHHPVAMENYNSTNEKPLNQCLKDIRGCDIFVGIYAFRYGFIPQGLEKSITHLEYEEALKENKTLLLFVIDEETPMPPKFVDSDRTNINQLRDIILKVRVVAHIKDLRDFGAKLSASIHNANPDPDRRPTPAISSFLPYMSNRGTQSAKLELTLDECEESLNEKPLICIVHGNEIECHDKFIKRLHEVMLPEILDGPGKVPVDLTMVEWPSLKGDVKIRYKKLIYNISKALTGNRKANTEEIKDVLNRKISPQMIYFILPVAAWEKNEDELIKKWLQFWNDFPALNAGRKLMVFLCIKYKHIADTHGEGAKDYINRNGAAKNFIEVIQFKEFANIVGLTLEELKAVPWCDVDTWITTHAGKFCDDTELRTEAMNYYQSRHNIDVPMLELAKKLNDLLYLTQRRERILS